MAQQTEAEPVEVSRTTAAGVLDLIHEQIDEQQTHAHGEGPYVEELLDYARELEDAL